MAIHAQGGAMESSLFRPQVLARPQQGHFGRVVLSRPVSATVLTTLLGLLTAFGLAFLSSNTYTRKVTVNGMLVPDRGLISVSAPEAGTIAAVHVAEGEEVHRGDRLFTLNLDHTLDSGNGRSEKLGAILTEQRKVLQKRLIAMKAHRILLQEEKQSREIHLYSSLQVISEVVSRERATVEVRRNAHTRALHLHKAGHIANAELEAVLMQLLEQEKGLMKLLMQQSDMQVEISELDFGLSQQSLELDQQIAALQGELIQLESQLVQLEADSRVVVRAPLGGRIGKLDVSQGMGVPGGQALLKLVPENSRLLAELLVPSHAMGFIAQGQNLNLRYDSYPWQKFGMQHGVVLQFSQAANQQPARPGQQAASEYRVLAEPENQTIRAYGSDQVLRAGMLLTADIVLENRTLLEWLLEPLFSIRGYGQ